VDHVLDDERVLAEKAGLQRAVLEAGAEQQAAAAF
jgi:hypothetical protein